MRNHIVLALVAAAGVSFAPQDPKEKDPTDPSVRQERFLKSLRVISTGDFRDREKENKDIESACKVLLEGSNSYRDEELFERLVGTVDVPLEVAGFENLGIVRQEKYLAFGMGILRGSKNPRFFYFVWYRPEESAKWFIEEMWSDVESKAYWTFRK